MAITEQITEHEFLFRWNEQGNPQGCHIAYRQSVLKDGTEIASKLLDPRPVVLDDAPKLAEIGAAINAATLAANTALTAERDAAVTAKATAEGERDAALAEAESLRQQLTAYQTPTVNGVPQFIKKWQLWAGLRMDDPSLTLYKAVKAYTESFTGMMRDLWLDSTGIERTAPALAGFKAGFGKTDADLDDMFTRYAAITLAQASALG